MTILELEKNSYKDIKNRSDISGHMMIKSIAVYIMLPFWWKGGKIFIFAYIYINSGKIREQLGQRLPGAEGELGKWEEEFSLSALETL